MTTGPRTVAIVQARIGSTRLPGKVLMQLAGKPMVLHVLERAASIIGVNEVVAAVPTSPEDDDLASVIAEAGFRISRGSPEDVLSRYVVAARATIADVVLRVTADCPLLSPEVSRRVLEHFVECDYASNTLERTFPRGLDTEVTATSILELAHREATTVSEREHVTPYIWRNPARFRLRQVTDLPNRSNLRWTVDTPEDMMLAVAVYDDLGPDFEYGDVLDLLARRPELTELNRGIDQKPVEL